MNCLMGVCADRVGEEDNEIVTPAKDKGDSIELARKLFEDDLLHHDPDEIVAEWEKAVEKGTSMSSDYYFDIYKWRFYPNRRNGYRYLERAMENREPSFGYHTLALMLTETSQNNLVITTNFDNLVEDALFLYTEKKPLVVSHESLACYIESDIQRPIVAKVHRGLMYAPFNSPETTSDLKKEWRETLAYAFNTYTPIVIGYGGGDHSLMAFLEAPDTLLPHGIYWCYLGKYGLPGKNVQKMVAEKEGYLVNIDGFDRLMYEMGKALYGDKIHPEKVEPKMRERMMERIAGYFSAWKQLEENPDTKQSVAALNQEISEKRENEKNPTAWDCFYRANKASDNQEYEKAIELYDEAIKLNDKFTWAYFNRGLAHKDLGNHQEALEDYNKAIALDSEDVDAYINRGLVYEALKEYEKALADYDKAIALNTEDADVYNNRGIVYEALKEYEKALADYDKAIALNTEDADAYINRGNVYRTLKEYEKALADYDKAIALDLEYAMAYSNRGNVYTTLKEYEKALIDYEKAIELDPKYANAYNNRGCTYDAMGEYEKALADYDKALELDSNHADAYDSRGDTYIHLGRYQEAVEACTKAIELDPKLKEAYLTRAKAYRAMGEYEKALADYDKALELDSNHANAYDSRGNTYIHLGRYPEAVEACTKAIGLDPKLKEAYLTRAEAYRLMDEEEKAKADEQMAAELD